MKNNKAFTLIELLTVVAILTLIIVIITPKVFKNLKTAEKVTDQEQINSLINTSKIYMNQNSNLLPQENDIYVISLEELKESGLIQKSQILNPSTNEELNGCIIVKFENNKYKYEYKEELEQITVTFDPQGGTLQETPKNVIPGEKYGTLPTPTREGYTFMGWNGKNLFNYEKSTIYAPATEKLIIDDEQAFKRKQTYNNPAKPNIWPNIYTQDIISYEEDKKYTISFNIWSDNTTNFESQILYINSKTNNKHNLTTITPTKQRLIGTVTYHDASSSSVHIYPTVTSDNNYYISNVQIEEGDTATEYEPYYITPSTTVVQENNHTLKAIWKANE